MGEMKKFRVEVRQGKIGIQWKLSPACVGGGGDKQIPHWGSEREKLELSENYPTPSLAMGEIKKYRVEVRQGKIEKTIVYE